jgi:hypothetical protein
VPPHRDVPFDLLRRALLPAGHAERLTRRNTAPGTAERQAVTRAEYVSRRASRRELSARQALGHAAPGDVLPTATFFAEKDSGPTLLVDVTVSRRDVRRVARYLGLVGQLAEGRIAPAVFARRVGSWRPIRVLDPAELRGDVRFLADPAAVLALVEIDRGEERESWIDSGRSRPSPRKRR